MIDDDELISDYLGGRLGPSEAADFKTRLDRNPVLAARFRFVRALRPSLAGALPPIPADLKAALKSQARARVGRSFWAERLLWALGSRPWSYGAAAAFAAAALILAVRLSLPGRPGQEVSVVQVPALDAPAQPPELSELWSDDDGGDEDEG